MQPSGVMDEYGLANFWTGAVEVRGYGSIEDAVIDNIEKFDDEYTPVMRKGERWYIYES